MRPAVAGPQLAKLWFKWPTLPVASLWGNKRNRQMGAKNEKRRIDFLFHRAITIKRKEAGERSTVHGHKGPSLSPRTKGTHWSETTRVFSKNLSVSSQQCKVTNASGPHCSKSVSERPFNRGKVNGGKTNLVRTKSQYTTHKLQFAFIKHIQCSNTLWTQWRAGRNISVWWCKWITQTRQNDFQSCTRKLWNWEHLMTRLQVAKVKRGHRVEANYKQSNHKSEGEHKFRQLLLYYIK